MIAFDVPGRPVPKGSARWIKSNTTGQIVQIAADSKPLRAYSRAIALAAKSVVARGPGSEFRPFASVNGLSMFAVEIVFAFERPRSHFRTGRFAHLLRDDAPRFPCGRNRYGDLDKLTRSVFDALSGIVWKDDTQIAQLRAVRIFDDDDRTSIGIDILDPGT